MQFSFPPPKSIFIVHARSHFLPVVALVEEHILELPSHQNFELLIQIRINFGEEIQH